MRIFISYAREDQQTALRIYDDLVAAGYQPWIDVRDIPPGQDWQEAIKRAIESSEYFISVLSKTSTAKRGEVQREMRIALDTLDTIPPNRVFVIPVRLDDCEVHFDRLKRIQRQDLFPSYADGIRKIVRMLGTGDQSGDGPTGGGTTAGQEAAGDLFKAAVSAGVEGKQRQAIALYHKAIDAGDPNPSLCYLNIGNRLRALGENNLALAYYEESVRENPKQADAWFGAAQLYSNAGDVENATRCYKAYMEWYESLAGRGVGERYKQQSEIATAYLRQQSR